MWHCVSLNITEKTNFQVAFCLRGNKSLVQRPLKSKESLLMISVDFRAGPSFTNVEESFQSHWWWFSRLPVGDLHTLFPWYSHSRDRWLMWNILTYWSRLFYHVLTLKVRNNKAISRLQREGGWSALLTFQLRCFIILTEHVFPITHHAFLMQTLPGYFQTKQIALSLPCFKYL